MFNSAIEGGPAATVTPVPRNPDAQLAKQLREHVQELHLILPIISVAVMALHRQNAELDEEIATVLDHHASQGELLGGRAVHDQTISSQSR